MSVQVVVIDDDAGVREFASRVLERAGHSVRTLQDGTGLRALLESWDVDLVLTDIFMPTVDGFELLHEMRLRHPHIPVIAMSGGSATVSGDHLRVAHLLKAAAVLAKPFSAAALLDAVREAAPLARE